MRRPSNDAGFSLVEIVIAAVIFGIVAAASMKAFMFISKQSVRVDDRAFAVQKAIQMMEELRSLIQEQDSTVSVLDNYDTGTTGYKYTLSTLSDVNGDPALINPGDKPGDPISGNGAKKYYRKVSVWRTNEPLSRQVTVRVFRASDGEVLAETSSVLRTLPINYVPSQVYDVYVLLIENVPGWWVSLSTLAPTFDAVRQDMENRDPGLVLRVHYITRLAYGRDPYYQPAVNDASPTNTTASPWVYFLPGNLDGTNTYYVDSNINANIMVDGVATDNDPIYSYSMADQYNNAVRQPDEEAIYAQVRALYAAAGRTPPEPSWRMLLDRMNGGPGTEADGSGYDYRNALVINLHGEMVPMPPMRNYSDPAKRPEAGTAAHRMYRIVSHPENIHAASGAEVRLRVYPFVADPNDTADFPNSGATFAAGYTPTIVVTSTATNSNTVRTALLQVGVNHNVEFLPGNYTWRAAVSGGANDYDVSVINSSQTLVTLYNSPIRHAPSGNYGLASTARLYGLEYIPCVVSGTSFSDVFTQPNAAGTLAENSATNAKNTARWVLRFPAGTFADGLVTFETRLNATLTEGYPGSYPSNMSRTYCWVGSTSTVPASEQSQFIGDPRHMPYADVKASLRYNWFFKDVNGGGLGYSSFVPDTGATLWDGFGADTSTPYSNHSCIDVPRFYEVLRKALLKTTSVMNSINGWSFYYLGIGGEIGVDANNSGYDSSVSGMPIMGQPWNPQDSAKRGVDEISEWNGASGKITDARIIAHSSDGTTTSTDWFGLFWIGELYPTMNAVDASAQWIANGNLRTGDGGFPNNQKRYFRAEYNNGNLSMGSYANTAVLSYGPRKEPGTFGAPSFFNDTTGTSSSHTNFNHSSPSNTADLTVAGSAVSQDFNFPLPSPLTSVSNNHRPFSQTDASAAPTEWDQASYYTQRATETIVETYYDSSNSGMNTSVLLNFTQGSQYGYFQPTGVAPQGTFGTAEIGKLALINVIRGFLTAGVSTTTAANIPQVPLVSISSPAITDEFNSPTSITIIWGSTWTRWDGQNYTSAYSGSYSGPTLTYNVKYTSDAGSHWYFLNTNVPAKEGLLNNSYAVTSPVVWNVSDPAAFPQGNYDVEVEAYRNTRALHYSYHRRQVFIKR